MTEDSPWCHSCRNTEKELGKQNSLASEGCLTRDDKDSNGTTTRTNFKRQGRYLARSYEGGIQCSWGERGRGQEVLLTFTDREFLFVFCRQYFVESLQNRKNEFELEPLALKCERAHTICLR